MRLGKLNKLSFALVAVFMFAPTISMAAPVPSGGHVDPLPPGPETPACNSVPSIANFTLTSSSCGEDEVSLTFAANGADFELHVQIMHAHGKDVLSAWCTGNEGLCKVIGNGTACPGTDYSGPNAWCYKSN